MDLIESKMLNILLSIYRRLIAKLSFNNHIIIIEQLFNLKYLHVYHLLTHPLVVDINSEFFDETSIAFIKK